MDRHVAPLGHIIMIPSQPSLCSCSVMLRACKLWFGMLCICILLIWYNCCNSGHVGWLVRYADIILKLHQIYSKDTSCRCFQISSCFRRENYSKKFTEGQTLNNKRQVIKMGNSEKYNEAYLNELLNVSVCQVIWSMSL